nr:hypothetical protein [Corynebacterium xerosis]
MTSVLPASRRPVPDAAASAPVTAPDRIDAAARPGAAGASRST